MLICLLFYVNMNIILKTGSQKNKLIQKKPKTKKDKNNV